MKYSRILDESVRNKTSVHHKENLHEGQRSLNRNTIQAATAKMKRFYSGRLNAIDYNMRCHFPDR
jgi:hypothetical protein